MEVYFDWSRFEENIEILKESERALLRFEDDLKSCFAGLSSDQAVENIIVEKMEALRNANLRKQAILCRIQEQWVTDSFFRGEKMEAWETLLSQLTGE